MKKLDFSKELKALNGKLKEAGMLEVEIVDPRDCIPQKKNARYFDAEIFQQLVKNIKEMGALESTPLVYRGKGKLKDKFHIVSGHHRVDGAKEAGLSQIMVLVFNPDNQDDIVMKQLAHNALTGKDDEVILYELFQSIEDTAKKMATGLADEMEKISYESLNFRVGSFKTFTVLFLPEDVGLYDETIELVENQLSIGSEEEVRLASIELFDNFAKQIRKIKMVENIKNNGVALMRLVELATQKMQEDEENRQKN